MPLDFVTHQKGHKSAEQSTTNALKHDPFSKQPKKFPVHLDEFCRIVIGGKSKAERLKIFRAFMRDNVTTSYILDRGREPSEQELIDAVEKIIVRERNEGMARIWFEAFRNQFVQWRANRRKEKAKKAAGKRWNKTNLTGPDD